MSSLAPEPVQIGDATLYLGDCLEILPTLGKVDAVVTDPPYGIGAYANGTMGGGILGPQSQYEPTKWDHEPCSPETLKIIQDISVWQIIFGGNYFDLPATKCYLVWDKENGDNYFADCELAWTNLPIAVRQIRWRWHGMLRRNGEERHHPTQKPLGVMSWCIEKLPQPNQSILDPFMGSGTTGVACAKLGRKFIGIEIEPKYFDVACRRIEEAYKQPDLFIERPKEKQKQSKLFE